MERVAIFIDGSNFYHGLKNNQIPTQIDFQKFAQILCAGRQLVRVYYFNVALKEETDPEEYRRQRLFFDALGRLEYFDLILGRLEPRERTCPQCHRTTPIFVEKGVDIEIATRMLRLAYNNVYDTAILVSGDGDFAPVVEAVKERGKHVENSFFSKGWSRLLRDTCDRPIPLDKKKIARCLLK